MTSRDRVLCAINHTQPDRVPLDYRGTPEVDKLLQNYFDSEDFLEALGVDIRNLQPDYIGPKLQTFNDGRVSNEFGIIRKPVKNNTGTYMEVCNLLYESLETEEDVENFDIWPSLEWYDYNGLVNAAKRYDNYAISLGGSTVLDLINNIAFGRGIENTLMDIAERNPVYLALVKRRAEFFLEKMERCLDKLCGRVDILFFGDDLGTQNGPLISPATYKEIFMPYHKKMIDLGHSYGAKVMMHCCGGTKPLFPIFIDIGLDVYQTVQPEASGMNPEELKLEFGNKISFNGTMSNQSTLPFGTEEEVRKEVRERINVVGKDGGLILAPSHNFQPDVPLKNILAMYDEAR